MDQNIKTKQRQSTGVPLVGNTLLNKAAVDMLGSDIPHTISNTERNVYKKHIPVTNAAARYDAKMGTSPVDALLDGNTAESNPKKHPAVWRENAAKNQIFRKLPR